MKILANIKYYFHVFLVPRLIFLIRKILGCRLILLEGNFSEWYESLDGISPEKYRLKQSEFRKVKVVTKYDFSSAHPLSEDYFIAEKMLHSRLTQMPIDYKNEATPFDLNLAIKSPFPFNTKDPRTIGLHLAAISWVVSHIAEKPNSKLLEFGPGWGNLSLLLAQSGFDVTGIDIEKKFIQLIAERAKKNDLELSLMHGDFLDCIKLPHGFDGVIFFESFHHCYRFDILLDEVNRLLNPGGSVYFAAEPISVAMQRPWGVRLDGESAYVARKYGWLELGFNKFFFKKLLAEKKFKLVGEFKLKNNPWGSLYVAKKI